MKALRTFFTGLFLSVTAVILITSCNNATNQENKVNQAISDTIKKEVTLSPENKNLLYQFPTPLEVTMLLQRAKAGYTFNITNPPANLSRYTTEKLKALNLGIYSADLAYSSTYNRMDETNKFLECTGKLANDLGISGIYDKSLVDRVKKFNNNKDSLVNLVSKVFNLTNDFLSKNNRNQIAVLIATGGFVEGIYLAASLNQMSPDNKSICTVIYKQKDNLDRLLTILSAYSMDSEMKPVADEVAKLKRVFTDFGLESDKKLSLQKAGEIVDLSESVRLAFTK